MDEYADRVIVFLIGLIVAIVGWLGKRTADELKQLRDCAVTRPELEKTLKQMREDRQEQHHENRAALERIERKIDENEVRASKTRHDTKDEVHALAVRLALISKVDSRNDR